MMYKVLRMALRALFCMVKLFTRQDSSRVLFLSRQANTPSLDFRMLEGELADRFPNLRVTCICCRLEPGARGHARYATALLGSMVELARSKVCVLDSYSPAVSMLRQREGLSVIQMWHAMGKVKQSGFQALGRPMGRSYAAAKELRMHAGYTWVIAGAPAWNPYYCAAFGVGEDVLLNIGLPRLDYLRTQREAVRRRFFGAHPELAGRKLVLYAPTFRAGVGKGLAALASAFAGVDVPDASIPNAPLPNAPVLLYAPHPNQKVGRLQAGVVRIPGFSALELLLVADKLVTDYSAIAVEAAFAGLETYYYCFDYEDYRKRCGVNVDLEREMPSCFFRTAAALARALADPYPREEFERYRDRYALPASARPTKELARLVAKEAGAL